MPVFHVRTPEGHVYNVNAPEGATEQDAINFVRSKASKAGPSAPPQRTWSDTFRDIRYGLRHTAGSAVDGLTGSWSDEVAGAGGALRNVLGAAVGMNKLEPGAAYTSTKRDYEQEHAQFARDHRATHIAATGVGMGLTLAAPEFRAARGAQAASRLARIGRAAATGLAYGTVAGAGKGEGTDRFGNAVEGGTAGLVLGTAAEPALGIATRAGGQLKNLVGSHVSRGLATRYARRGAQREIAEALATGGHTPQSAASAVSAAHAEGVPMMAADVTDGTRSLMGYAGRGLGPGQQAVREALYNRQGNMAQRVRGHIDETLGSTANPHVQSAELTSQARTAASPLYDEAYQTPITVTPNLREFMDSPVGPHAIDAGANAIRQTPSAARNLGSEQPFTAGHVWDQNLSAYRSGQAPVLETWDGAKRYLDDLEFQTNSRFLANPQGMTSDVRPIDLSRRQLLAELDAQAPAYARARQAFAGPTQDRRAFEVGLESAPGSARASANDARAQMDGMSDSQLAQFRLGDRTRLADDVYGNKAGVRRWGDATNPINGNDARIDLVRTVHGDDAAERLLRRTDMERQGHLTYRDVFGNSATPARGAVDEAMGQGEALKAAGHLARGNPLAAAWTILTDAGKGRGVGRYTDALKRELGSMLGSTDTATVQDAMRGVEARMQQDAHFQRLLQRSAVELSKGGVINVVGHSGDETGMYDQPNN